MESAKMHNFALYTNLIGQEFHPHILDTSLEGFDVIKPKTLVLSMLVLGNDEILESSN